MPFLFFGISGRGSDRDPGREKDTYHLNSKSDLCVDDQSTIKPNADPTGFKDVEKGFWVQAPRGVAAQIFYYPLFNSPLEHVGRLICRKTWICGDGIGSTCEVNETHLLRLRKIPFAYMFVSLLSNLKAGQSSVLEFSFQSVNGAIVFCISQTFCTKNDEPNHQINLP